MSSQLLLYRTVGEFRENSSDVRSYMSTTVRPAPARITTKFVVRAVVLTTTVFIDVMPLCTRAARLGPTFPTHAQLGPLFLRLDFVRARRDDTQRERACRVFPPRRTLFLIQCTR